MSLQHKIQRTANAPNTPPDETETALAQALVDLENNVPELKTELRPLQISAAREVDVRGGNSKVGCLAVNISSSCSSLCDAALRERPRLRG